MAAREKVRRFVGQPGRAAGPGALHRRAHRGPRVHHGRRTATSRSSRPSTATTKVFDLTIDHITWQIDAMKEPVAALGYNGMWPGPALRVVEGDKVRINFTNNLDETTGVHMHGIDFDDFRMDGIPFVTQLPITPGRDVHVRVRGQAVGLPHVPLAPQRHRPGRPWPPGRVHRRSGRSGRTLRREARRHPGVRLHPQRLAGRLHHQRPRLPGHQPIVAKKGERVLVRYMNEGVMMHPWHTHGFRQHVVARDGAPLGSASFYCDTLGVNPGERFDAIVDCDRVGVWALHCHILPHVEGLDGMFGMVTALVVTE